MQVFIPVIPGKLALVDIIWCEKTDNNIEEDWNILGSASELSVVKGLVNRSKKIMYSREGHRFNTRMMFDFVNYNGHNVPVFMEGQESLESIGAGIILRSFLTIMNDLKSPRIPEFENICITGGLNELADANYGYFNDGQFIAGVNRIYEKFIVFYELLYKQNSDSCFIFCTSENLNEDDLLNSFENNYILSSDERSDLRRKIKKITNFNELISFIYRNIPQCSEVKISKEITDTPAGISEVIAASVTEKNITSSNLFKSLLIFSLLFGVYLYSTQTERPDSSDKGSATSFDIIKRKKPKPIIKKDTPDTSSTENMNMQMFSPTGDYNSKIKLGYNPDVLNRNAGFTYNNDRLWHGFSGYNSSDNNQVSVENTSFNLPKSGNSSDNNYSSLQDLSRNSPDDSSGTSSESKTSDNKNALTPSFGSFNVNSLSDFNDVKINSNSTRFGETGSNQGLWYLNPENTETKKVNSYNRFNTESKSIYTNGNLEIKAGNIESDSKGLPVYLPGVSLNYNLSGD